MWKYGVGLWIFFVNFVLSCCRCRYLGRIIGNVDRRWKKIVFLEFEWYSCVIFVVNGLLMVWSVVVVNIRLSSCYWWG